MSRRARRLVFLVFLLAPLACSGARRDRYVPDRDRFEPNARIWMLSEEREVEIGREAQKSVEREYEVYHHPALQAYVDEIGLRLAAVSDRPNLDYEFKVVDSPIVNAFALPGGFVYVTRGLLGACGDEAQLAGVMGHEIGHVAARHSAQLIQRATAVNIVANVAAILLQGKVSPDVFRGAGVAMNLVFLGYSRDFEGQADILGMKYLYEAGYDPRAMLDVMEALRLEAKEKPNTFLEFFRSHPYAENREAHLNTWLARTYLADTWAGPRPVDLARNKDRFQETAKPHALWGGEADVRAAVETFRIGLARRDAEMCLGVVSKSYRDPEGRTYAEFERDIRSLVSTYERIDYAVQSVETDVEEDRAQARYTYSMRVVDAERNAAFEERGREYLDLRREPGEDSADTEAFAWRITSSRSTTY